MDAASQPSAPPARPFGKTGLNLPPVLFGTSCLGNLYQVVPEETKLALVSEMFRHAPLPVVLDSAGKYGAGMALEAMGRCLRSLAVDPSRVIISNKLGWYRVPLKGKEPAFEPGVWAGLSHDAETRISHEGILACFEQGLALLGPGYSTQLVSLHDPDEYLAAASDPAERSRRLREVLEAYRALFELKRRGLVKAVGIGSKDWRVIREIAAQVDLDWVMFACSLTVYTHPRELLAFINELRARGVGLINSAVFNAGFLTGGKWFNYRQPDPLREAPLYAWRDAFLAVCRRFDVPPATVCVQFGLELPGIHAVALNTERPERIRQNIDSTLTRIPPALWRALKEARLIDPELNHGA
jgi:D-threo-aldose 1-dehydrogenase